MDDDYRKMWADYWALRQKFIQKFKDDFPESEFVRHALNCDFYPSCLEKLPASTKRPRTENEAQIAEEPCEKKRKEISLNDENCVLFRPGSTLEPENVENSMEINEENDAIYAENVEENIEENIKEKDVTDVEIHEEKDAIHLKIHEENDAIDVENVEENIEENVKEKDVTDVEIHEEKDAIHLKIHEEKDAIHLEIHEEKDAIYLEIHEEKDAFHLELNEEHEHITFEQEHVRKEQSGPSHSSKRKRIQQEVSTETSKTRLEGRVQRRVRESLRVERTLKFDGSKCSRNDNYDLRNLLNEMKERRLTQRSGHPIRAPNNWKMPPDFRQANLAVPPLKETVRASTSTMYLPTLPEKRIATLIAMRSCALAQEWRQSHETNLWGEWKEQDERDARANTNANPDFVRTFGPLMSGRR